jgi:hypothetical protein
MNDFIDSVTSNNFNKAIEIFTTSSEILKDAMISYRFPHKDDSTVLSIFTNPLHISTILNHSTSTINVPDTHHLMTPLMTAAMHNRVDITKTLVSHGADVNLKDRYGKTALSMVIGDWLYVDIVEALLFGNPIIDPSLHHIAVRYSTTASVMVRHLSRTNTMTDYAANIYIILAVTTKDLKLAGDILCSNPKIDVRFTITNLATMMLLASKNAITQETADDTLTHALTHGLNYDIVRICVSLGARGYDISARSFLWSSYCVRAIELFIAFGMHTSLTSRDFEILLDNSRKYVEYREMYFILLGSCVTPIMPTLTVMAKFALRRHSILEENEALKKRIQDSQLSGDWRRIIIN